MPARKNVEGNVAVTSSSRIPGTKVQGESRIVFDRRQKPFFFLEDCCESGSISVIESLSLSTLCVPALSFDFGDRTLLFHVDVHFDQHQDRSPFDDWSCFDSPLSKLFRRSFLSAPSLVEAPSRRSFAVEASSSKLSRLIVVVRINLFCPSSVMLVEINCVLLEIVVVVVVAVVSRSRGRPPNCSRS